ncbi:MAG: hypothetical protein KGL39_06745 [Patescibacteria group bacterium]|nr:hypothetical protein [Patescibacteria group bacterium]
MQTKPRSIRLTNPDIKLIRRAQKVLAKKLEMPITWDEAARRALRLGGKQITETGASDGR